MTLRRCSVIVGSSGRGGSSGGSSSGSNGSGEMACLVVSGRAQLSLTACHIHGGGTSGLGTSNARKAAAAGSGAAEFCVLAAGKSSLQVTGCCLQGVRGSAVAVRSGSEGKVECSEVKIIGKAGLFVHGHGSRLTVASTLMTRCGRLGSEVSHGASLDVSQSDILRSGGGGLLVRHPGSHATLHAVTIQQARLAGIDVRDGATADLVQDTRIRRGRTSGLLVSQGSTARIGPGTSFEVNGLAAVEVGASGQVKCHPDVACMLQSCPTQDGDQGMAADDQEQHERPPLLLARGAVFSVEAWQEQDATAGSTACSIAAASTTLQQPG